MQIAINDLTNLLHNSLPLVLSETNMYVDCAGAKKRPLTLYKNMENFDLCIHIHFIYIFFLKVF